MSFTSKSSGPSVSIIIATTAESRREQALLNALRSLRQQKGVFVKPIVVVNGNRYSEALVSRIKDDDGVEYHYLEEGNCGKARRFGREKVQTLFFGFLDDDDEYYEDAMATRLEAMFSDSEIDVVITNGIINPNDIPRVNQPGLLRIPDDLFGTLIRDNWMAPCSALFRTSSIPPSYFDPSIKFFEWFYLSLKLARDKKLHFIDHPCFHMSNTPGSASKSEEYQIYESSILTKALELEGLPRRAVRLLKQKQMAAFHDLSSFYRANGQLGEAWKCHLRSLTHYLGWRYLPYTRKLFFAKL